MRDLELTEVLSELWTCVQLPSKARDSPRPPEAGLTAGCVLDVGAGNKTLVVYKSSEHS